MENLADDETEEEKAALQLKLKISLYDDLEFDISEVFEDV